MDSLQNENKDIKLKLRKKEDLNFCSGCERIIAKGDKKVKCSVCAQEYCFKCSGNKLFYCYICMGYVCCEEMKQAQLCDVHITKQKEKFGQLFSCEATAPADMQNPEVEQTFGFNA